MHRPVIRGKIAACVAALALAGCSAAPQARWERPVQQAGAAVRDGGSAPTQLRIPVIGVDAGLVELRLDGAGALEPPADYAVPGWYADGTAPGDMGPAVIAGHVDSRTGPAVFYKLRDLLPGDVVQVLRGEHWIDFEVTATGRYPKDHFPTAEVYGPTPDAQLRLITCGGFFDRARDSYRDNVVVYAIIRSDVQ